MIGVTCFNGISINWLCLMSLYRGVKGRDCTFGVYLGVDFH